MIDTGKESFSIMALYVCVSFRFRLRATAVIKSRRAIFEQRVWQDS
jgi:hypothetical protein